MKYIVRFYFDGHGKATVEAGSEQEARVKFDEGDTFDEKEYGCNYEIDTVTEVK